MTKTPRNEQETIIGFDVEMDEWMFYSNYPVHIRRWRDKIIPMREEFYSDGTEKMLEGIINGSAAVYGKRTMTVEQRKELVERMKVLNKQNQF